MDKLEQYFKLLFAITVTTITRFLGGWDMALQTLIIMIALDYGSGLAKAFYEKRLSSEIGAKGIVKKVMMLLVVVMASQLDIFMNTKSQLIRTAVIYFYVANEGISILENLTALDVPFSKVLRDKLLQLKGKQDDNKN